MISPTLRPGAPAGRQQDARRPVVPLDDFEENAREFADLEVRFGCADDTDERALGRDTTLPDLES